MTQLAHTQLNTPLTHTQLAHTQLNSHNLSSHKLSSRGRRGTYGTGRALVAHRVLSSRRGRALFLVRHGNNIGRETGRGTGNSWRRIEKVIHSDSFWVCAATADAQTASNSLYLWFVVSASLSTDFQWQDASESSRYRHTSSSVNIGGGWENYSRTWKHLEARIQIDFRWVLGGVAVA